MSTREERIRQEKARRRRKRQIRLRIRQIVAIALAVLIVIAAITMVVLLVRLIIPNKKENVQPAATEVPASSTEEESGSLQLYEGSGNNASGNEKDSTTEESEDGEEADVLAPQETDTSSVKKSGSGTGTITISAAGDCTLGVDENADESTNFAAMYEEQGYAGYFFENVKSVFEEDDLTIVNLEGTLTTATEREDKTFAFKGDPSYVEILTEGSVEAVNLANNHSHDYGTQSYEDTISNVEAAGITSFGYDRTAIQEVNGVKAGLVGIYELADGIDCKDDLLTNIKKVQSEGADIVIVSFHWGTEKEYTPNDVQKELAHAAVDAGADLVLGHHPHVLEGIEEYNGKNIVYSLGNFCFGGNKNPSDKNTMIFQQTFTVKDGQVTQDNVTNIIPCTISSTSDYNDYQPTIAEGDKKQEIEELITQYSSEL
ncbi:MAG: CapA family protein [Lachnospiraceae bacterium]|nr:CapA family protein [Lachnospiraceae bacterium]MDD3616420.1 CapA family protein [Lachnospiraceae bacterium]